MEQVYLDLLKDVLNNGIERDDRTGTGTLSVFGRQLRFDLSKGFPAITTKKLFWKGVVAELLWFLKGSTNVKELQDQGVKIWDEWADANGELGPVYGKQWRKWEGMSVKSSVDTSQGKIRIAEAFNHDQIKYLIETLKNNPNSRRMIVSTWNVGDLANMALEPCHILFQVYVAHGKLSLQLYQRSADLFLGVPFNIASYALLTHMLAQVTGYQVGEFIHTFGDAHIYLNHLNQVKEQLSRDPKPAPRLLLNSNIKDIDSFKLEDCQLHGYNCHPPILASVAV